MRESPFPLEQELGMHWYASDTPGIGGRLRTSAEDFVVEEEPCRISGTGPYLICRMTKRDWDQQRAVKELAKRLGISHRRIGWSGTKDTHAVTSQLISIYDISEDHVRGITIRDITVEVVGRSEKALALGSLEANRFGIVIREISGTDALEQIASVTGTAAAGLPNYFGVQRFGVIRPITHRVGEEILREDYREAVLMYIGQAFPGEPGEAREARSGYLETLDAAQALHAIPVPLRYERALLHHLVAHPDDFRGALLTLPPRLLSMFVSAFQSYLFNHVLSWRLSDGRALDVPEAGDRLLFSNGKEDVVTSGNVASAALHLSRERCRIALFIPGNRWPAPSGPDDTQMAEMLRERGITPEMFSGASHLLRTTYAGALRPIALRTKIAAECAEDHVRLSFRLQPGHYATTVCREYMKTDPVRMI